LSLPFATQEETMRISIILALIIALSLNVYSQAENLTLNQLINSALERNPEIKSLQDSASAQKSRVPAEGTLPDPVLGFSLKNVGLDRFTVGEEMMSGVGFFISQAFPFPGKLRLKSEIALKGALQADERLKASRLSIIRQVKELYSRLFFYNRSLEFLRKKKEVLENAFKAAEVKYSVGKGIQSDLFKAQVEISAIEEMTISMEQMLRVTEANINSLLDFPPERPLGVPLEIEFYELKPGLNELLKEATKNSPLLKEAELMVEENETEVKMAKKEFFPNFMVQAGKDFKGPLKDMYEVMVSLEIPLYQKKKQANLLAKSLSELSGSKNQYLSMKNELNYMLQENFLMAKTSESLLKLYKERIIPQASMAVESSLANYKVDRVDFLALLSDINSLFSYELEYIKNLSNLWVATAKIEELTAMNFIK
jgi:cobalt-zinc-cadmium efflux system outer membrane protein